MSKILLAFLLLGAICAQDTEFVCPKEGVYADPFRCDAFISCVKEVSFKKFYFLCAPGDYFNEQIRDCDLAANVPCSPTPPNIDTFLVCTFEGLYADSFRCDAFIKCVKEVSFKKSHILCGPGSYYSEQIRNCDLAQNVACVDGQRSAPTIKVLQDE